MSSPNQRALVARIAKASAAIAALNHTLPQYYIVVDTGQLCLQTGTAPDGSPLVRLVAAPIPATRTE